MSLIREFTMIISETEVELLISAVENIGLLMFVLSEFFGDIRADA